jgi:hypothetical protein
MDTATGLPQPSKGLKSMAKATDKYSIRTAEPDPIFAAIDNHRKLDRLWLNLAHLEDASSPGASPSCAVERGSAIAEQAAWKLAKTKPTTAAGAAAMLAYITTGPITGLFELGETHWHETAFRTVVAALAEITGQSRASSTRQHRTPA